MCGGGVGEGRGGNEWGSRDTNIHLYKVSHGDVKYSI